MCIMICGQLLLSVLYVCAREITVEFSFVIAQCVRDSQREAVGSVAGNCSLR